VGARAWGIRTSRFVADYEGEVLLRDLVQGGVEGGLGMGEEGS